MNHYELHNNISAQRCIAPVAVGTTGTGTTGKVIDRRGYRGVEFIISYGTITGVTSVFTVIMKEGDTTGTLTSVADADMLGLEANAGLASGTRASGTNKNVTKRIGYKGIKRYVTVLVKSTVTATTPISVDALLYGPDLGPVAT
jgi:hypothetical protein